MELFPLTKHNRLQILHCTYMQGGQLSWSPLLCGERHRPAGRDRQSHRSRNLVDRQRRPRLGPARRKRRRVQLLPLPRLRQRPRVRHSGFGQPRPRRAGWDALPRNLPVGAGLLVRGDVEGRVSDVDRRSRTAVVAGCWELDGREEPAENGLLVQRYRETQ